MTLKTRLAVMMIVLLVAVMALQALLTQRQHRAFVDRLQTITREIDESTRDLSESTQQLLAEGDSLDVEAIIRRVEGRVRSDTTRSVMIFIGEDSTSTEVPRALRELTQLPPSEDRFRRLLDRHGEFEVVTGEVRREEIQISAQGDTLTHTRLFRHRAGADSTVRLFFKGFTGDPNVEEDLHDLLTVHVPLPANLGTPHRTMQLLFPVAGLLEELEEAQRRNWMWLAALLAVGALGAVLVAVQFTRPIRALETSFGRVEHGDLDLEVKPERPDEIGRLTSSFNEMVARLRETKKIEGRLTEAERLAAVGRLAAGVAHEVRNPLNAMRLTMEQLRHKTAPSPETAEREQFERYTNLVVGELGRLEHLVSTFLDLSRSEELVRERVDVNAALRGAVELFQNEAREQDIDLVLEAEDNLSLVGDPGRLPTVWNNLLTNSLQATPPSGRIRVQAVQVEDQIVVRVIDDGPGIDPEILPRVWEPFFSGRTDGTGLGLSLVRSIVTAHGGTVDAQSSEAGTTMTVRFPCGGSE